MTDNPTPPPPDSTADDVGAPAAAADAAPGVQPDAAPDAGDGSDAAALQAAGVTPFVTPNIDSDALPGPAAGIELLDDVELNVKVELGRAEMYIDDVLRLGPGSVVQLDKLAGDSVDVFVNEQLVARGEVLVLNENFCVRVNEIISPLGELDAAK